MHGGARRVAAVAMAVGLLGGATGCQEDGSRRARDDGPARAEPGAPASAPEATATDWEGWQPSYHDVQPATEEAVRALGDRATDLGRSEYTVQLPLMGVEMASSPEHVRVSYGKGYPEGFDLHLDPRELGDDPFAIRPFVVCEGGGGSCTEVGKDGVSGGGPHLFNNGIDSIVFTMGAIVSSQRAMATALDPAVAGDASTATVDSPAGPLDCLVLGSTARRRAALEGAAVDLAADPVVVGDGPEPLSTICLDAHGLAVVTLPSLLAPLVPYGSYEPGVPAGFDQHADPVPYGTEPSESPSEPAATSGTSGTEDVEVVLVAAEPIAAGESLADVQQTGRLELRALDGGPAEPGAMSSTKGLHGVALHDIAEGDVITTDDFG